MKGDSVEYDYFYAALFSIAEKRGRGFQVSLSISTKIAEATISNIMNKERLPNLDQQIKIAKALDYNYMNFLALGKQLLQGEEPPAPAPASDPVQPSSPPPPSWEMKVIIESMQKQIDGLKDRVNEQGKSIAVFLQYLAKEPETHGTDTARNGKLRTGGDQNDKGI